MPSSDPSVVAGIILKINPASEKPPVFHLVLVQGGVAFWNGEWWVSATYCVRRIEWDVLWWADIPVDSHVLL